jgi:hypothetical protein
MPELPTPGISWRSRPESLQIALDQLDTNRAQVVLDLNQQVQAEVIDSIVDIIHQYTISDKFKVEQVPSDRTYPSKYQVRPVEAQVTELRKVFPSLGSCMEKLGRKPPLEGAEAWFAIPRWQALAPTYMKQSRRCLELSAGAESLPIGLQDGLARPTFASLNVTSWRKMSYWTSSRGRTSWSWQLRLGRFIAVARLDVPVWRWPAMNLAWASSPSPVCCSPIPNGSLQKTL